MDYDTVFNGRNLEELKNDRKILLHYGHIDNVYYIDKELARREANGKVEKAEGRV